MSSEDWPEMSTAAECARCDGRGWFSVRNAGAGSARRCGCRDIDLERELLSAAALPPHLVGRTLEGFETSRGGDLSRERLESAKATARSYLDGLVRADGRLRETGLLFYGPPGSGKSHLAAAVLAQAIRRHGLIGRFVALPAFAEELHSRFEGGWKRELVDPLLAAELIVLDDLGVFKPSAWAQEILYLVVNGRYVEERATIVTTRYSPKLRARARHQRNDLPADVTPPLAERVSPPLLSRLAAMTIPVSLTDVDDFRAGEARGARTYAR